MMSLTVILLVACSALGKRWSDPVLVQTQDYYVVLRGVYMDPSTGTAHILYGGEVEDEDGLAYVKLLANGTVAGRTRICKDAPASNRPLASITGRGDGKSLYVVSTRRVGYYDDVYFYESSDDGVTWSPEVNPRKDPVPDDEHRLNPSMIVLKSGQIVLFYNGHPKGLTMVTRDPATKEWSAELSPYIEKCDYHFEIGKMYLNAIEKSETEYTVMVSYKCPNDEDRPLVFVETNDLKNFKDYVDPRFNNPIALAFTMDKANSRIFFACATKLTYQSSMVSLMEYRPGGKVLRISLEPLYEADQQSVGIYYNKGVPTLVHLQHHIYIESDESSSLTGYPINKVWKSELYPLPTLGKRTNEVHFLDQKGNLLIIGKSYRDDIMAAWLLSD